MRRYYVTVYQVPPLPEVNPGRAESDAQAGRAYIVEGDLNTGLARAAAFFRRSTCPCPICRAAWTLQWLPIADPPTLDSLIEDLEEQDEEEEE